MCSAAILRFIIAAVSLGYAAYFYRSMQAAGDSLIFPRIEFFTMDRAKSSISFMSRESGLPAPRE